MIGIRSDFTTSASCTLLVMLFVRLVPFNNSLVCGFTIRSSSTPMAAFNVPRQHPLHEYREQSVWNTRFQSTQTQTRTTTSSTLLSSSCSSSSSESNQKIPITLLAGFLGSGKTSTLQSLLTNNDGLRIGVIVNDMASVNIDQKLIVNPSTTTTTPDGLGMSGFDVTELKNGCACCSLADELLDSVTRITSATAATSNSKGDDEPRPLDAIVVELSGIADPIMVRDNWSVAELKSHPATRIASVSSVVTLIDSTTFGTDYMSYDTFGDRKGWLEDGVGEGEACMPQRDVPELLVEQIEAADVLLVNKVDLVDEKNVGMIRKMVGGLNSKADMYEVEYGKLGLEKILGEKVVFGNPKKEDEEDETVKKCSDVDCTDPNCEEHETTQTGSETTKCTKADCTDADCTDHNHEQSHEHNDDDGKCNEPKHDDSHSHSHNHDNDHNTTPKKTSVADLGITSFVYRTDRPFDTSRLMGLLNSWPVPMKDTLDLGALAEAVDKGYGTGEPGVVVNSPFTGVLRSKGFCWMAPQNWDGESNDSWRHDTAMFWSHAGRHFGITTAGKWWGSITKEQMKNFFPNNMQEYERILAEDFASEEWGDRRQELVFIGVKLDETEIRAALDACLCTDEEMEKYRREVDRVVPRMGRV